MEKAQDSYKSRMAQKWGIPVVSMEFVDKCIEAGKLLEADQFIVVGKTAAQEFSTGKIVGTDICLKSGCPMQYCKQLSPMNKGHPFWNQQLALIGTFNSGILPNTRQQVHWGRVPVY